MPKIVSWEKKNPTQIEREFSVFVEPLESVDVKILGFFDGTNFPQKEKIIPEENNRKIVK